jgi:hypothetical protein
MCPQMPHQIVLGHIGCIAPINLISQLGPILFPMDLYGNLGEGGWQPHLKSKNKNKKPNVKLNILNEGYPLNNEGIA